MPIVSPLTVGTTGDNVTQVNIPYVHVVPLTVGEMAVTFTPQGWQCPVCKGVYSPDMVMCMRCKPNQEIIASNSRMFDSILSGLKFKDENEKSEIQELDKKFLKDFKDEAQAAYAYEVFKDANENA